MKTQLQLLVAFRRRLPFLPIYALLFCLILSTSSILAQTPPQREWVKQYQAGEEGTIISSFVETSDGFLLGGSSSAGIDGEKTAPSKGGTDFWIIKTDKDGNKIWDKTIGGSANETLVKIFLNSDGTFLLIGHSGSPISGDRTAANRGGNDFWLVKISASGNKIWDKAIGGNYSDNLADAIKTTDGNLLLAGTSYSGVSGERSQSNRTAVVNGIEQNTPDYWVVKVNMSGSKIWDKAYGGGGNGSEFLRTVKTTPDGGYILLGHSQSDIGYEKSMGQFIDEEGSPFDLWVIKTNGSGDKIWDQVYGGNFTDRAQDIIATPDGGYIISCFSNSGISGNKTVEDYEEMWDGYVLDHIWMFKISQEGVLGWQKAFNKIDFHEDQFLLKLVQAPVGYYMLWEVEYRGNYTTTLYNYNWSGETLYSRSIDPGFDTRTGFVEIGKQGDIYIGSSGLGADWSMMNGYALSKYTFASLPTAVSLSFDPLKNYAESAPITVAITNFNYTKIELYNNNIKVGEQVRNTSNSHNFGFLLTPGVHHFYAKAVDEAGNSIISSTLPLTVFAQPVVLHKAINLNGSTVTVDKIPYQSTTGLSDFSYQAKSFSNQTIALNPVTDAPHARLIRSCLYGTATSPATYTLNNVPDGEYEVYMYTWEDNFSSTFSVEMEGKTVLANHVSGTKGSWKKLGPFSTTVLDGTLQIRTTGGDANISSIEVWKINRQFQEAWNMNGPTLQIDGRTFQDARGNPNLSIRGKTYTNQSVPLIPTTDLSKSTMLRSCIYSTKADYAYITMYNLEYNALYDFYVYVWEDNNPTTYTMEVGFGGVTNYNSGPKGTWSKLGPFRTPGYYGYIYAFGGDANISGIEIWKVEEVTVNTEKSNSVVARIAPAYEEISTGKSIIAYPNPVLNDLTLKLPKAEKGKVSISILDASGKIYLKSEQNLKDQETFDINTLDLKPGLYLVKIKTPSFDKVIRITKE